MVADPKLLDFLCPLCGSNLCLLVFVEGREGRSVRMPWYRCSGCTVLFHDPKRFSVLMQRTYIRGDSSRSPRVEERPLASDEGRPVSGWKWPMKGA
jgi:hypothetical protein